MSKPKKGKERKLVCLAYVAAKEQPSQWIEEVERKQINYIRDYARAHNIQIKSIIHRAELGAHEANRQFEYMIKRIQAGEVAGIIVANMMVIANDIADAYYRVGRVNAAGGCMVTVEEGKLRLNLKERCGYERY